MEKRLYLLMVTFYSMQEDFSRTLLRKTYHCRQEKDIYLIKKGEELFSEESGEFFFACIF